MIIDLKIKNCFIFENEIKFSMNADMRNKKFGFNVHKKNGFNILKSSSIYGTNNVGKTCFIKCIKCLKDILLNKENKLDKNMFSKNNICEMSLTFLYENQKYLFEFKYDVSIKKYIYEKFSKIIKDKYNNEKENCWLKKDRINNIYEGIDEKIEDEIKNVVAPILIFDIVDSEKFKHIGKIKKILTEFSKKICIINMNNISIKHTIDIIKNEDSIQKKVVEFIKNSDLYLDNIEYSNKSNKLYDLTKIEELNLISTYKGVKVPSIDYDSMGTKKITAISSYIIEALEKGNVLVVDELDSSLHFLLTRSIVSIFNNELNENAQLIFTTHDINLLDCKKLFRKEQIWFIHKDDENVYIYSLSDFTSKSGIRDTTDIIEKYKKGMLGAIPEPNLIDLLINIKEDEKNGKKLT